VFVASDQIATGLVTGLYRAGRPVPDAVAEVLGTVPRARSFATTLVVRESGGCGPADPGNG
jgi:hypothetical protein